MGLHACGQEDGIAVGLHPYVRAPLLGRVEHLEREVVNWVDPPELFDDGIREVNQETRIPAASCSVSQGIAEVPLAGRGRATPPAMRAAPTTKPPRWPARDTSAPEGVRADRATPLTTHSASRRPPGQ